MTALPLYNKYTETRHSLKFQINHWLIMTLLKKPNDILPFLLCIFGLLIVYSFPLYTPIRLTTLDNDALLKILSINYSMIKNHIDIFNRMIISTTLIYLIFLYYRYLKNITFVISIILISHSIFYMAILANLIPIPNINFFVTSLLAISLWHFYFLRTKTVFNFIISGLLYVLIAFMNPVFSIFLSCSLIVSSVIITIFNDNKENYFYSTFTLFLCGFCSLTVSILKIHPIDTFTKELHTHYHYPAITSFILSIIILSPYINQKIFTSECSTTTQNAIFSYGFLTFIGATVIGRFDYIAHFM